MKMQLKWAARHLPPHIRRLAGNWLRAVERDALVPAKPECSEDASFRAFVIASLDRSEYLRANPDVAAAGADPVEHWLSHGLREGRGMPGLTIRRGDAAERATGTGWQHFAWRGTAVAVRSNPRRTKLETTGSVYPVFESDPNPENQEDATFRAFVISTFDESEYLRANPDVAAAAVDPVEHWLNYGLRQGRTMPGFTIRRGYAAKSATGTEWTHFTWRGEAVAVRSPLSAPLLRQIMHQARHDPAVLAPGALAVANLRRFDAPDLLDRDGVDVASVLSAIPERPLTIFVVPFLLAGGAEKYAADLLDALLDAGGGPALIFVTDQTEEDAKDWKRLSILSPLLSVPVIFWRDTCKSFGHSNPVVLARLLNLLRPKIIVVINSRVGLEAIARFGRGLSQFAHLCCAYFSMGVDALGAPYGTRFPRLTLPFAVALTDNEPMAKALERLYGHLPGPGVAVLPPRLHLVTDEVFADRLIARSQRVNSRPHPRRWAWVSRVEPFKGTALLSSLAKARPDDQFEVFGPVSGNLAELGLELPNVTHRGVLSDVTLADLGSHDGYFFTSLFEGMPNIVLEISQHAIPMILADVGGIRQTFNDDAALFVTHSTCLEETVASFTEAFDRLIGMTATQTAEMVMAARLQAVARHSPSVHRRRAAKLFGLA